MSIETKKEREQLGAERCQLIQEVQKEAGVLRSENRNATSEELETTQRKCDRIKEIDERVKTLDSLALADSFTQQRYEAKETSNRSQASWSTQPTQQDRDDAFRAWLLEDSKLQTDKYRSAAHKCGKDLSPKDTEFKLNWKLQDAGYRKMQSHMRSANVTTSAGAGGDVVTINPLDQLVVAMTAFGGMFQTRMKVQPSSNGAAKNYPQLTDLANKGRLIAENAPLTVTALPFTTKQIATYKFSSDAVQLSYELLEDTEEIDIIGTVTTALGVRLGRVLNQYLTSGTSSSEPEGILHSCPSTVTAASTTAFTYLELVSLMRAVDDYYQPNAEFMMSQAAWTQCLKLVDGNGRPILSSSTAGIEAGYPDTLMGRKVIVNYDLATPAAANVPIIYGDFSLFMCRQVNDLRLIRLNELYASNDLTGFIAYKRMGSGTVMASGSTAYTGLTMHA